MGCSSILAVRNGGKWQPRWQEQKAEEPTTSSATNRKQGESKFEEGQGYKSPKSASSDVILPWRLHHLPRQRHQLKPSVHTPEPIGAFVSKPPHCSSVFMTWGHCPAFSAAYIPHTWSKTVPANELLEDCRGNISKSLKTIVERLAHLYCSSLQCFCELGSFYKNVVSPFASILQANFYDILWPSGTHILSSWLHAPSLPLLHWHEVQLNCPLLVALLEEKSCTWTPKLFYLGIKHQSVLWSMGQVNKLYI